LFYYSLHWNCGQKKVALLSPGRFMHGFCASGSNSQNPAGAFLGRMAVFVGSYQFLQKAHFFTPACFTLMVCHKAMVESSLKIILIYLCES
jgi:hypothetical protein